MTDQPATPIGGYSINGVVRSDGSGSSVQVELTPAPAVVRMGANGKPLKGAAADALMGGPNGRIHLPIKVAFPPDLAERLAQDLLKQAITARVVQSVAEAGPEGVAKLIRPPTDSEGEEPEEDGDGDDS